MKLRALRRRTFLRGMAGGTSVALALPLLEAMLNDHGTALAGGEALPQRFGVWFWGNGTHPGNWAPAVTGAGWVPSDLLMGIAAVKDYINVVSGGSLPVPGVNNPHVEGAIGILAGGNPLLHASYNGQGDDWNFLTVPTPSVDEIAADHLAGTAPFRNLTLAVTPVHTSDAGSTNHPGTAISYISHPAPYVFNPPIPDPSEMFAYLFGAGIPTGEAPAPESLARAKVLDAILADAGTLEARLGASDKQRLEQHLEGIFELQNRLTAIVQPGEACALLPDPGNPASERERARVMADLVAMAFACDLSRVMTLEFSSPASHVDYPDIGIASAGLGTSFHEYEHQNGYNGTVITALRYFIEVFGDFVGALHALPEAGGTLLDNSCILATSDVSGGWDHAFNDFPLLVAGRAGGALVHPGVHVALSGDNAARVPLTCLRAIGAPVDTWGTDQFATNQPVTEILA
jgi:hypothetical protein